MLIRTQDKTEIINMDRLTFIGADEASFDGENTIGIFVTDDLVSRGGFLIGKYSTMEKSEKVLDMIIDADRKDRQLVPVTIDAGSTSITQFAIFEPQVFQMPQDEEVDNVQGS